MYNAHALALKDKGDQDLALVGKNSLPLLFLFTVAFTIALKFVQKVLFLLLSSVMCSASFFRKTYFLFRVKNEDCFYLNLISELNSSIDPGKYMIAFLCSVFG